MVQGVFATAAGRGVAAAGASTPAAPAGDASVAEGTGDGAWLGWAVSGLGAAALEASCGVEEVLGGGRAGHMDGGLGLTAGLGRCRLAALVDR